MIASGGNEPYLFNIKNRKQQKSPTFTGLGSQYYTIYVTDAANCQDSIETFIGSTEGVRAIALTQPSGCGQSNGQITVVAKNGISPYKYQLGEIAEYTYDPIFTGLTSGKYSVWVKDSENCLLGIYPVILTGVSVDRIKSITDISCSSVSCHGESAHPTLVKQGELIKNADRIQDLFKYEPMHYNHSLSEEDIILISCWANDLDLLK